MGSPCAGSRHVIYDGANPDRLMEPPRRSRTNRVLAVLIALLCAFGLDALAFRTPWYAAHLESNSTTGLFELILWREQQAQKHLGDDVVVTLGDSRFGIIPKISNALEPETGYVFRSAGVAGTEPRSWYYMLRDLDPSADRYRAIVLGVDNYDDEDVAFTPDDDIRALHYCIARLRVGDIFDFASSFHSWPVRQEVFRGALLKGIVYQTDLHEFLVSPGKRLKDDAFQRGGFEEWTYNFLGTDTSMAGLKIDWSTLTAVFPPNADGNQRETVKNFLLRAPVPQTGRLAAFRREWFGRIIDRYRNSRTKIVFTRLPRGPIPRPAFLARSTGSVIRQFASRPNVILMDEHYFEPIEHPELFGDGMHMNKNGCAMFSTMIAREISRLLGGISK
jgi:hypothetical protein